MLAQAGRLFFLFLGFHRLQVFGLENLTTVETFHIVHPVPSGQDLGAGVLAGGLHSQAVDEKYSNRMQSHVKPQKG